MADIDLLAIPTCAPEDMEKKATKKLIKNYVKRLNELQNLLYAEDKRKLLIVLQGLDASGKDGTVRKVFSAVNPQGVRVQSFKKPTEEELAHDFLWRIHRHTPRNGMIQIFNRSHYEDVLVPQVEGWLDREMILRRYQYINAFEHALQDQDTIILKFYLHISEEEQSIRFQERLDDPRKNWKFSPADLETAKKWPEYRDVYHEIFNTCSPDIPWIIVPSDQKWYKEYIVAKTIVETLERLGMEYPRLDPEDHPDNQA